LGGKYAQTILLVLLDSGEQKKTTLMRNVSKSSSMQVRMDALENSGLISVRSDNFDHNTKWVGLTDRGKDVAVLLKQISDIMKE
jgi:DNA-binding HxlR family transcriptional regulator